MELLPIKIIKKRSNNQLHPVASSSNLFQVAQLRHLQNRVPTHSLGPPRPLKTQKDFAPKQDFTIYRVQHRVQSFVQLDFRTLGGTQVLHITMSLQCACLHLGVLELGQHMLISRVPEQVVTSHKQKRTHDDSCHVSQFVKTTLTTPFLRRGATLFFLLSTSCDMCCLPPRHTGTFPKRLISASRV